MLYGFIPLLRRLVSIFWAWNETTDLERLQVVKATFPTAEKRAGGHQWPQKLFQQHLNVLGSPARPTPHLTSQSQQVLSATPLPSSHPPQRLTGPTQKNKENAITHTGIWKDCLCIPQEVKGLSIYQSCQDRAQRASCALIPLPLPAASIRSNPPPVFLAAGQLWTVLFWHHLPHPLWVCNPHQSCWEGARKSFATSVLEAYKT